MARAPAAAAGRGAAAPRPRSPPRPGAGGVNALVAGMANIQVADPRPSVPTFQL